MTAVLVEDLFSRSLANQLLLLPEGIVLVVHGRRFRGGGVRAILAELIRFSLVPDIWDEYEPSIASQSIEKLLEWVIFRDEVPELPER
jgi:hypothetical protein